MAAFAIALLAALALSVPTRATASVAEPSGPAEPAVPEPAAEAAPVVAEPEPEPVPVEAEAAAPEAEVVAPEEAPVPSEAAVAEEAVVPEAPPVAADPESEPAEIRVRAGGVEIDAPAPDSGPVSMPEPVRAAGDLTGAASDVVGATGVRPESPGRNVAPVSAAGLEQKLATLAGPLKDLTPLEVPSPERLNEVGSLVHTNTWAGPAAGSTDPAPVPGELLPTSTPRPPERGLPAPIDAGLQLKAPVAGTPSPAPSASEGVHVPHRVSLGPALSFSPSLPVLLSAGEQAQTAKAASAEGPARPPAPERSPSDHSRAGSGAAGSNFLPLLGLLALLALAVPRGYRRRMAVRHFPVPTSFACALERPG